MIQQLKPIVEKKILYAFSYLQVPGTACLFEAAELIVFLPTMDLGQQLPPSDATYQAIAEHFPWDVRFQLIGLGFAFYALVFLLAHLLSSSLCHTYNCLQAKEKVFWNLAATRAVFGIQSSVVGLRTLILDSRLSRDIVSGQEDWSWFTILTATGFFIFENAAFHVYSLVFRSLDLALATHHFFALAGYGGGVMSDSMGHFVPMVVLLLEMSTPFTCVSWMLLKVKQYCIACIFLEVLFLGHI